MKKLLYLASVAIALFSLNTACDLDQYPTNQIPADEGLLLVSDAESYATGIMVNLRARAYGAYSLTPERMSDFFNASVTFGNNDGDIHRMDNTYSNKTSVVRDLWAGYYGSITQCNYFLGNVDAIPMVSRADSNTIKRCKGEAYFVRAFSYHQLAKIYCEDYEPNTAANTAGLPLLTEYDVTAKVAKSNLEQTYARIVADLNQAEILLANVPGRTRADRPTLDAVKALRARVQLCMHQYPEAAATAASLIALTRYNLASSAADFTAMWLNDNGKEDILQLASSNLAAETHPTNTGYMNLTSNNKFYQSLYIPTQSTIDRYEANDLRLKSWFSDGTGAVLQVRGTEYPDVKVLIKYPGNPALRGQSANTDYKHKIKIFRIAEMYLIQAEALWRSGGDAATPLNALRASRGLGAYSGELGQAIQDEWARETIGEGVRIECLKRWHVGFMGRPAQNTDIVTDLGDNYTRLIVAPDDYRLTMPIPYDELINNPNMVQNPRWSN